MLVGSTVTEETLTQQSTTVVALDSLDRLPNEVLEHILAFSYADDEKSAAKLTISSKRLYALSNKPLAAILVRYLKEADQTRADAASKRKKALTLAACKPFLMFTKPDKNTACAAAYTVASVDLYITQAFLDIASRAELMREWLSAAEAALHACDVNEKAYRNEIVTAYKEYKVPNNYLLPLFNAYMKQIELINKPAQTDMEVMRRLIGVVEGTQLEIGLELTKLKRWLKDEFFRESIIWSTENEFANIEPLEQWVADYFDEEQFETRNVLINANEEGNILGVNCAAYRGTDNQPTITYAPILEDTCTIDFAGFARLYNSRYARLAASVEAVRESLTPAASK